MNQRNRRNVRTFQTASLAMRGALLLGLLAVYPCLPARAQQQQDSSQQTGLSRNNDSRVAASAAELKAILLKDSGMIVELKRWAARDASEHGQLISDSDLTNEAILARLEVDVKFRAVATALVQRYGYLVPKLNPESDMAKEHELLVQERTKWLAQAQESQRAQAQQKQAQELQERQRQNASSCDPQSDDNCKQGGAPAGSPRQLPATLPSEGAPSNVYPPSIPVQRNSSGFPNLLRTEAQSPTDMFSLEPSGGLPSGLSMSSLNAFTDESDSTTLSLTGRQSGALFGGAGSSSANTGSTGSFGGFGNSGAGVGNSGMGGIGMGGLEPQLMNIPDTGQSGYPVGATPLVAMQPASRFGSYNSHVQSPQMIRAANPYNDIPSLYDMYLQAVPRPEKPERFGTEIFENGTRNPQLIPMDLPAGPDYVVGPGDALSINLFGGLSQRLNRTVDREGRVSLPEVGPVLVSGKTLASVQQDLQQTLRTQFRDVSADVSLARLRTVRIYDVGDVVDPGAYDVSSLSTPLNALFAAGGPTQGGSLRILKHYRGSELVEVVDIYDLLLHGVKANMQHLESGDTILIPPIGPQVTVEGMVRRPAIYELRDEKSLSSVLELAGGLLPAAALRHIEVQRLVAHDKQTMLSLDIPESDDASEVTKQLDSFEVHDGDQIRIYPIAAYNADAVYLEGHVERPGRYSYQPNMHVTDVISSYKDILPEPAGQYAEIIRLNAPDFRPSVESFNLADALANPAQSPVLHPMDTVRIFSRFDFENPPTVSVLGDVRMPGTYQTSGQIHLADAIHLAGGLTPEAATQDVQVFRQMTDGTLKIFSVSLEKALGGDPIENIILESRDRLLIHRNADDTDPATVYIRGDVGNPGRYPLTTNMRVADLIRVGGGLNPSADKEQGDLTTCGWSQEDKLIGHREAIPISAVLSGDTKSDVPLHNGDVLTIRELPGWNDLGASIMVKGEVKHPGTFGIRPGEHLSTILERAGGFEPDAYPYGAVLQRIQVRDLQVKEQDQMILRVKDTQNNLELLPAGTPQQQQAKQTALEQWQTTLEQLTNNPPVGRLTIRISPDISRWKNTVADPEVMAGDIIVIPKKPTYVLVTGQVYNPTAIGYRPGRSAKWYLGQSGGPTALANKKTIFVIRADGSVIGSTGSLWSGESLGAALQPGDTVGVPEKAVGGSFQWQSLLLSAQMASSIATAVLIGLHY